MWLAAQECAV